MRLLFLVLLFLQCSFANVLSAKDAFKLDILANEQALILKFNIVKDHFLYHNQLKIKLDNKDITALINYPQGEIKQEQKVYFHSLELALSNLMLDNYAKNNAKLSILYQGCSNDGLCYAPQKREFRLYKEGQIYKTSPYETMQNEEEQIALSLKDENLALILFSFFGYGLLLSLTPCTLPMIPILSSLIIAKGGTKPSKKQGFLLSLIYVFFMSLAYALAGILASVFGVSIQALLQQTWLLVCFSLLFVFFAFVCFSNFNFELPKSLQGLIQHKTSKTKGILGVALMGFLSALIVGPCVAAPLAGALLYLADSGSFVLGGLALFTLSFGMGVPLLFVGLGLGFLKPGFWMEKVRIFFGFIMLAMALWILSRVLPLNLILLAYGILGVFFVVFMGLFERACNGIQKVKKALLILVLTYSLMLFLQGIFGASSSFNPLNFNQKEMEGQKLNFKTLQNLTQIKEKIERKEKVLLYFTASWCEYCKILDAKVFSDERIIAKFANYEKIKIDVSENNATQLEIMKKFDVFAPPVLIFFDKGERRDKITGYITGDELLKRDL
ncbi:protein-disulfide reductase DsbD [Campylobacter vulpis]|uniref:protein-disulfide reductase DsbD n=1 Tax=Campylobacter vulpis TaxID=1655500 RepID=UPI001BCC14AE|nr:protein-disulfide reductase DsbD [Campylobacter vulpis]MBS4235055.1 protein-disulfide reductase DsbD [Campylobacter vulpis]